ncbi:MAG: hypothetical protein ACM3PP_09525 [Candidatus Saccharibacteria bacterium]
MYWGWPKWGKWGKWGPKHGPKYGPKWGGGKWGGGKWGYKNQQGNMPVGPNSPESPPFVKK